MINADLIKLQHFFEVDTRLKKEMYYMAPPTENIFLDQTSLCEYTNKLDDSLIYIFNELKRVSLDMFGENSIFLKKIEYMEKNTKREFYKCGLDINQLRTFYKNFISNMELSFIDKVKETCVGYSYSNPLPIDMANSINEILHLIHSYILNNERILQAVPMISEKTNDYNYPIRLRGVSGTSFRQLFEQFPSALDVGWTDIICLNEKKALMMIRDRGHALTIEVTLNNNIARIEYFIPKICNVDMVNELPGINKINENSIGARGVIEVDASSLSPVLFGLISKVPMDSDMVLESRVR